MNTGKTKAELEKDFKELMKKVDKELEDLKVIRRPRFKWNLMNRFTNWLITDWLINAIASGINQAREQDVPEKSGELWKPCFVCGGYGSAVTPQGTLLCRRCWTNSIN